MIRLSCLVSILFCLTLSPPSGHAWTNNSAVNDGVCTVTLAYAFTPHIVTDGSGGMIIGWYDLRSSTNYDVYAQRLNSSGVRLWPVGGVAITTATLDQFKSQMISDGSGGAILVWEDQRSGTFFGNSDIYVQRVNSSGVVQWTTNGVAMCTAPDNQFDTQLTSDGAGGAIVVWVNESASLDYDVYAQRVNSSGVAQWGPNGTPICALPEYQYGARLISDGAGGAIIAWEDWRTTDTIRGDIYMQRMNSSGVAQWGANGVPVCAAPSQQTQPKLISDGSSGAIITWTDARDYGTQGWDNYAQRVNSSGIAQWMANGIALSTAAVDQINPALTSDGSGGAIVSWQDSRGGGSERDIYAQRVNGSGAVQWIANGNAICTLPEYQLGPQLISDGSGGAIVSWQDFRADSNGDIYAQRVNGTGNPQWIANGVAVSTAIGGQGNQQLLTDSTGGAYITWQDGRSVINQIYASHVTAAGALDPVVTAIQSDWELYH